MQKVVSNGLKIDLHIHSIVSSHKDGTKVKNNTLDNIPLLIKKLNDQNVNICSITDHDTFSYDFYVALKQAESEKNSIQKVLPGVEFSVCFFDGDRESVIHVVTIFSDEDEKKIQAIEELLRKNPPTYKLAYKEEDFLDLLRRININTILIAHQKNTLTSTKARKNDANTLGEFKFLEFVYTDYFEAFEFKNRRNEILNKAELKFVSLDFYNGVYKGKSTAIELTNAIKDDKYKKGNYIFSCLNDIITSIQDEIHEPLTETLSNEAEPAKLSKAVSLYELSACAGDGFFMDGASAPEREIKTEYLDADYAVRISGKSMEPTITDGSIVFVKHVNELNEGDIGIFLVDGNVMCKRYCLDGGEKWLRPDNESPEFNAIRIKEGMNCLLQGKVLG